MIEALIGLAALWPRPADRRPHTPTAGRIIAALSLGAARITSALQCHRLVDPQQTACFLHTQSIHTADSMGPSLTPLTIPNFDNVQSLLMLCLQTNKKISIFKALHYLTQHKRGNPHSSPSPLQTSIPNQNRRQYS